MIQPATPVWATPIIRKQWAEEIPLSSFRKNLQRIKFESDTVDNAAVRDLYTRAFDKWKSAATKDSAFELVCLAAYFRGTQALRLTADELKLLKECLNKGGDYSNVEFCLVAATAFTKFRFGKLDLDMLRELERRAPNDPLMADLSYEIPRAHMGLFPQLNKTVTTIKRISAKYPLRDEYFSALLMMIHVVLWARSGEGDTYRAEAIKYVKEVINHEQSVDVNKRTARGFLKMLEGGV